MDQMVDERVFRRPVIVLEPSLDGRIRIADANHRILAEVIHGGTALADMIAEAINAET
jgi:hypothetical protein